MDFTERIFGLLDKGETTLVFPTENTARHYLSLYVRNRGTGILAERAVALDSFASLFAPVHREKPSNRYHRLAFVSDLLQSSSTGLDYLYKDTFFSFRRRFIPFLSKILPSLRDPQNAAIGSERLRRDLVLLKDRYAEYLRKNGLFEPGWEEHSLKYYKGTKLSHVLVGCNADMQMQKFSDELGEVPGLWRLDVEEGHIPDGLFFEQYGTQEAELQALFSRLEKLKNDGVSTADIVISTPEEGLLPRLRRKALEYDIPLSVMGSPAINETVPGRFLESLSRIINEDFSFQAMENLFLNSSLPFADAGLCRSLVLFMIDNNIRSGSSSPKGDVLLKALGRAGESDLEQFYKAFRSDLISLHRASERSSVSKALHAVTALLLGPEEFNASASGDRDVYSFIISALSELGDTLDKVSLTMDGMFAVFMDALKDLPYVAQDRRTGIRVYRYGQDNLITVPWHFVIGLTDSNVRTRDAELGFLDDHEVPERRKTDITDALLSSYCTSGENVFISGSATTYEGSAGSPIFFISRNRVKKMDEGQDAGYTGLADLRSHEQAEKTSLSPSSGDFARGAKGFAVDPATVRLSYSSISSHASCPYMAYARYFVLDNPKPRDNFEPALQDDAQIGDFLHKVIQAFMRSYEGQFLSPDKTEEYKNQLEQLFDRMLSDDSRFDFYTKQSIRGSYADSLKAALEILLVPGAKKPRTGYIGSFRPLAQEFSLKKDPAFTGYIDTIVEDTEGKLYLLDYKKGDADPTYQLVLYRRLYLNDPRFGDDVGDCWFYSMNKKGFRGFEQGKWEEKEQDLDTDIGNLRKGYGQGDWTATPSNTSCTSCSERMLCRRRFNLQ